jgi:arylsulfatase A-like enzyme
VLYAITVVSLCSLGPSPSAADAAPPNVVLIVCDDQAWFHFGFMGNEEIRTPHLDRLAAQSALFPRGYVPTSVCRPSLATIITGRYPHEHHFGIGLDGLGAPPARVRQRFAQYPPIPQLLGANGYLSMQTGKWWEGAFQLAGFTHGMTTGKPVPGSVLASDDDAEDAKPIRLDRGLLYLGGAEGLRIGREGLGPVDEFLRDCDGRPFFLWYAPMLPHTPHNPPERLVAKYRTPDRPERIAGYMAMCKWFDETCGELLAMLDERHLSENTLVVFVVDNGYVQLPGINWFTKRSKLSPYEGGIRTPILLRWPGRIKPARYQSLVHTIDVAPTILAACGIDAPAEMPGINLLDVCEGKALQRDAIFGATFRHKAERPRAPADTVDFRWCISGRWKLIVPRDPDKMPELYDVAADPHESNDLAEVNPDRVAQLRMRLDRWWSAESRRAPRSR